jgi:hypothetical protein
MGGEWDLPKLIIDEVKKQLQGGNMSFRFFLSLSLCCLLLIGPAFASDEPQDNCGTIQPVETDFLSHDTLKCAVLFGWSNNEYQNPEMDEMKPWMNNMWDTTRANSIPHFYHTSTYDKFRMTGTSFPADSIAFVTDSSFGDI